MNEKEKSRYSRQIRLSQIGEAGQQKLLDSTVLIIGMGGLGSPVAMYLAAAGIGSLMVSGLILSGLFLFTVIHNLF